MIRLYAQNYFNNLNKSLKSEDHAIAHLDYLALEAKRYGLDVKIVENSKGDGSSYIADSKDEHAFMDKVQNFDLEDFAGAKKWRSFWERNAKANENKARKMHNLYS